MINFVLMEIGKKQPYIFKSNKLKENIGASMIIKFVTEELPKNELSKNNGKKIIEGGGKSIYSFDNKESAKNFIKNMSKKVITNYPGLEIYFSIRECSLEKDNVVNEIDKLYKDLMTKKAKRINSVNQQALGIEKKCESTGLPAVDVIEKRLVSSEIKSKIKMYENNKKFYFKEEGTKFYEELDDLTPDEKSYIAIIHIDGNSMGNKFTQLSNLYKEKIEKDKSKNNEYLSEYSKLSKEIDKAYKEAFKKVIENSKDEEGYSSIRPIIIAGDDITFIASAKDAIKLTKIFIDEINKKQIYMGNKKIILNAAAGIAFIKSHYPFDRGYDLAEKLTANCKSVIKKNDEDASMIDWHVVQGEESDSIRSIREEHYVNGALELNLRPLYLNKKDELNSYENFKDTLKVIQNKDIPRSKIKGLRAEYKKGSQSVHIYMNYYGLNKYLDYVNGIQIKDGIYKNKAMFYDAIELMDLVEEV